MVHSNMTGHRPSGGIQFLRLGSEDIPLISQLLMSTWPREYGKVGSPVFSEDYLKWILGGPNQTRHILLGCKMDDELVAYQSFLSRRVAYRGVTLNGYLNTHGTISPKLPQNLRLNCGAQMVKQHALFVDGSEFFDPECDLVYAFFDEGRPTKDVLDKLLIKYFHVEMKVFSVFNQCVVMPTRLREYLLKNPAKKASFEVKPVSARQVDEISELFNRFHNEIHFTRQMTKDELRHHFFGNPDHHTYVVENEGAVEAFINFYPLEIIKGGTFPKYVVIEFLITEDPDGAFVASLLQKALDFGEKIEAKAIVFENATYLDYSVCHEVGLIPSFRKMIMTIASRNHPMECGKNFRCDVK